ncbi:DsbA family protein [Subtercola sp. PAMC28395]|uniref:DsbA family protein n=1 Tax=Subtercola sp. PAMC28395 TaxID=2846775 RepID=UPI001C0D1AAF|nr:thioredoxin domain-containing protein [Subtercola sp. PAMC28395]QWT22993.1 DsbA family protein [Subtercola sp. PAMC28395]
MARVNIYEEQLRGLPKKERKALSREFARIQREDQQRRKKRTTIILRTSLITVGVALLAVGTLVTVNTVRAGLAGPANMASDGIVMVGDGTNVTATKSGALAVGQEPTPSVLDTTNGILTVVEYIDYSNADAATFETTNGAAIQGWVKQGYATLEIHPVALASTDGNDPGARAANAIACVANTSPDSVLAVHNALIADHATIASAGLSDADLVNLVTTAGVTDAAVSTCITSDGFANWVGDSTARAKSSVPNSSTTTLTSTPLVLVDGAAYTGAVGDQTAFQTFVTDTFTKNTPASTATPTRTPTP